MSDLYGLSEDQMAWLRPCFSKSHGVPRGDDRRVPSDMIFINRPRSNHLVLVIDQGDLSLDPAGPRLGACTHNDAMPMPNLLIGAGLLNLTEPPK